MHAGEKRLILVPGMGCDARLFEEQRRAFPDLYVPAWIEPVKREPLESYARRLAATVPVDKPYVLGGVSMGGMLALEMARVLEPGPTAVVLIATCRCNTAIRRSARWLERVSRWVPDWVVNWFSSKPSFVLGSTESLTKEQVSRFMRMYTEIPVSFRRWSARACLNWSLRGEVEMPVYHIHGGRDLLMPVEQVKADQVVRGGGHLINMSHAEEVNRFIAARLVHGD